MNALVKTHKNIAEILSFEISNSYIEQKANNNKIDWDSIVKQGSKHLILPAIYCRLQNRNLLHILPKELEIYLDGITDINRNRNKSILKQAKSLSLLLNENNISHVFLKGTALLASNYFKDIAERMVGDIDILISKTQLQKAFNIIKENGYRETFGYAYKTKDFRHLDRLISKNELAAVELHSEILNKKYRNLLDIESFIETRVLTNGIATPTRLDLGLHQILGWQINDYGHYYNALSLKSLYDSLVLDTYNDKQQLSRLLESKYGKSYIGLAKNYLKEFNRIKSEKYLDYRSFSHKTHTYCRPISILIRQLKTVSLFITKRLRLILTNKSYRKHLLKKIFLTKK